MSKNRKNTREESVIHGMTRREFIARSARISSAALFMPAWTKLLLGGSEAHADPTCPTADRSWLPFMTVNLDGGGSLQANYVPKLTNGDPLASYSKMGMGTTPVLQSEFGVTNGFFLRPGTSGATAANGTAITPIDPNGNGTATLTINPMNGSNILVGIKAMALQSTLDCTSFVATCLQSRDDTGDNKLAVDGLLSRAGLVGDLLPNLSGFRSATGINHKAAYLPPPTPLIVTSTDDIVGSVALKSTILASSTDKTQLAKAVKRLSESQMLKIATASSSSQVKDMLDCVGIKNVDLAQKSGTSPLDPANDVNILALRKLWGVATTAKIPRDGGVAYAVLNGYAGSGSINIGGYDYHTNDRKTGNGKDLDAGILIGRLLQTAAILGKKLFLYVSTNGSVVSGSAEDDGGQSRWVSDFGLASCVYMFYYEPPANIASPVRRATTGSQVGYYTSGQIADPTFYTGGSPELAAAAIFANYMKVSGKMDIFQTVVDRRFDLTQLDNLIKFT